MTIYAIINQKGGTGKTTTAINLGTALASLGKKVLLIDLDPQANLTYSFGIKPKYSIVEVLQGLQTLQTILIEKEGLYIAPGSLALADLEVNLINKLGREQILKERLKGLTGFDYVFIDNPPSLSLLTVNALTCSNEVLIPLQMEVLALEGLQNLLKTIAEVKGILNKGLKVAGIIPVMFDNRRKLSKEILAEINKNIKEKIFKTVIRECVRVAEAPSFSKSVIGYSKRSTGAEDYLKLAKEFIKG